MAVLFLCLLTAIAALTFVFLQNPVAPTVSGVVAFWPAAVIILALLSALIWAYFFTAPAWRHVAMLEQQLCEQGTVLEAAFAQHVRDEKRTTQARQEANHLIGNALATISSLLGLQMIRAQSPDVREALEAARLRVHAIAATHRRLNVGEDFEMAHLDEVLAAVVEDAMLATTTGAAVEVKTAFDPFIVSARDATTIGIVTSELVTNALRHAFGARESGRIVVSMQRDDALIAVLTIWDNGTGWSRSAPDKDGFGWVIVNQLAGQFGGSPAYDTSPDGGARVAIPMPTLQLKSA